MSGATMSRVLPPEAPIGPDYGSDRACACHAGYRDSFGARRCGSPSRLSEFRARLEFRLSYLAWAARRVPGATWSTWNEGQGEARASYIARALVVRDRLRRLGRRFVP